MLKLFLLNLVLSIILQLCLSLKDGSVQIPVTDSYLTPTTILAIGPDTDQTYLRVLLSTASSETWVPSVDCNPLFTWCRQHRHYNYKESNTYVDSHRNFTTHFLDHDLTGRVTSDRVELGEEVILDFEFGEAISSHIDFTYSEHDGVVGLGPKKTCTTGTPLTVRLLNAGLDDAVFSFSFSSDDKGSLVIGEVQHDKYTGNIVWSKIVSEERWQITSDSLRIGSSTLCGAECVTEFNTEIEMIIGPTDQVEQIYKLLDAREIPGVTIRSVECAKVDSFPDLTFSVKGHQLTITSEDYVERSEVVHKVELCFLMITAVEEEVDDRWIMGTLAHKAVYVVYDFGRNQVGLAEAA
ncbi:cathepsin D-like [Bolinopsis microptera]|uniref:cathepsin D-like n=1 Tax=Bolinopsis microptera TaxID=2820187 RepID=UPI0030797853